MPTSIWSLFARESTESSSEETQMTIEQSMGAASAHAPDWDSLDWSSIRQQVRRLQMRIAKAISQKRHSQARSLQWLLTHSYAS
jgi:RNA-directed DNA polymerase